MHLAKSLGWPKPIKSNVFQCSMTTSAALPDEQYLLTLQQRVRLHVLTQVVINGTVGLHYEGAFNILTFSSV